MLKFRTPRPSTFALPALLFAIACADQDPADEQASDKTEAIDQFPAPSASDATKPVRRGHGDKRMGGKHMGDRRMDGKHMKHGHRGPEGLVHAALRNLDLTDTQRKTLIELKNPSERPEAGASGHDAIRSLLNEGWKTGTIDQQALDAAVSGMEARHAKRVAEQVRVIDQLHRTLTADQRKALVAKLQEKQTKRPERPHHDVKSEGRHGGFALGMLRGVELSDSQRAQLEALVPTRNPGARGDFEQHQKQRAAMLDAFVQDSFDAAKFIGPSENAGKFREFALARADFVKKASKVLTEDQRAKLVERLNEAPRFGAKGRPHLGPPGSTL